MSRLLHSSDCALHNAPAFPATPCDCGAGQVPRIVRHMKSILTTHEKTPVKIGREDARTILRELERLTTIVDQIELTAATDGMDHIAEFCRSDPDLKRCGDA